LHRDVRLEPRKDIEVEMISPSRIRRRNERLQEVSAVSRHVGGQNSDYGEGLAVDGHSPSDDTRVSPETSVPVRMGQDQHMVAAGLLLFRRESAAQDWLHTQRGQPIRRYARPVH